MLESYRGSTGSPTMCASAGAGGWAAPMPVPFASAMVLLASQLAASPAQVEVAPVAPIRLLQSFRAPVDRFAAGHRGIDLQATPGQPVLAPISGMVMFAGPVAGRPVIVVADGRRVVSIEPVESSLRAGQVVAAASPLGQVGLGGHCSERCVHLGLRIDGTYVVPIRMRVHLAP